MKSRVKECPHLKANGISVAVSSYAPSLLLSIPDRVRMSRTRKAAQCERVNKIKNFCLETCPYPDGCILDKVKKG